MWVLSADVRREPSLLDRFEGRLSKRSDHSIVIGVYEDRATLERFMATHSGNKSFLSFSIDELPVVRAGTP